MFFYLRFIGDDFLLKFQPQDTITDNGDEDVKKQIVQKRKDAKDTHRFIRKHSGSKWKKEQKSQYHSAPVFTESSRLVKGHYETDKPNDDNRQDHEKYPLDSSRYCIPD
jgi:hypothetical protein